MSSPVIICRPNAAHPLRLFCFSYAGGHAGVFASWQAALEPYVEICGVQLPGRGSRIREPFATAFAPLVEQIARGIADSADGRPFAFFGHSLGALLAFETARLGARMGSPAPIHLFLSGSEPAASRPPVKALHLMPDRELMRELQDFNGTPAEVLRNDEMMMFLLPMLRADFALVHDYRYRPAPRLTMPISVLAGRNDNRGNSMDVGKWGEETTAECRLHWFDGDHFFINSHQHEVIDRVRAEMLDAGRRMRDAHRASEDAYECDVAAKP